MTSTIALAFKSGPLEITPAWVGQALAVHRPYKEGEPITTPNTWQVTHRLTGMGCGPVFDGPKTRAIALAKLWDSAFESVKTNADASSWRYHRTWAADLQNAQNGLPLDGPVLPDNPTAADVGRAMAAAIGGPSPEMTQSETEEQYPAADCIRPDRLRTTAAGILELRWRREWYPVPTMGEVEEWVCDSVCDTPDGDTVEPDAPESWLSILGLI